MSSLKHLHRIVPTCRSLLSFPKQITSSVALVSSSVTFSNTLRSQKIQLRQQSTASRTNTTSSIKGETSKKQNVFAALPSVKPNLKITVVGIGGAGCNSVNNMLQSGQFPEGVDFIIVNTDKQCLDAMLIDNKIQIGINTTAGMGAGAHPEKGREAAQENLDFVIEQVKDSVMVFFVAGMGGGTGTGATPVLAAEAKKRGILSVAMVYTPFTFEGRQRAKIADEGLLELEKSVDALFIFDNEHMFEKNGGNLPIDKAFKLSDDAMLHSISSITDVILKPGLINLDIADVKSIMQNAGRGIIGVNTNPRLIQQGSTNPSTASPKEIVEAALEFPSKDLVSFKNAEKLMISISGAPEAVQLAKVNDIITEIERVVDNRDIFMLHGATTGPASYDGVKACIILTGVPRGDFRKKKEGTRPKTAVEQTPEVQQLQQKIEKESLWQAFWKAIKKIF